MSRENKWERGTRRKMNDCLGDRDEMEGERNDRMGEKSQNEWGATGSILNHYKRAPSSFL